MKGPEVEGLGIRMGKLDSNPIRFRKAIWPCLQGNRIQKCFTNPKRF